MSYAFMIFFSKSVFHVPGKLSCPLNSRKANFTIITTIGFREIYNLVK